MEAKDQGWTGSIGSGFVFSELHADALLRSHPANIRYLSRNLGSAGLLLVEPAKATLFTDSRYTFQAREEVKGAQYRSPKKES